ncbi:glycolate oxidase subunit GlcE [Microbaculum marinisediminis]|uniref:Glycolate oxidase subunit GlcE n=1 Tax=Microbaculum marinisediminis TaxID=2931392 RepID=A0AAW5QS06_9HYPH|nr:glycolate oxidase subunit GlcE [Microbaculum sp. A6E488]MCT8970428.1 glycolate oxidase subunit GlcE [Microbaculum sp. A6E488]
MSQYTPDSEAAVEEIVRAARARSEPLEIAGGGGKRALGRPVQAAATLSLGKLAGITLYEPSELVIAAKAGTPLAEIEARLKQQGQRLPFDPPRLHRLYGGDRDTASIGAVVASNLSGPRRVHAGAARDSLIGVRFVNGAGETVKSGGRVMKNVTGLDLVKLMSGAFGTLGVLTEVTFKALPAPETEATLVFEGLDDHQAVACLSAGLGSPWEVTGAAHLPAVAGAPARTLLRLEGFETQMAYRGKALGDALAGFGGCDILRGADSAARWAAIGELEPLAAHDDEAVWKVSTTPNKAPEVAAAIRAATGARLYYDWGGGLIWVAVPAEGDAGAAAIRAALSDAGGHATCMRAPDEIRAAIAVFEPQPEPVMALTRKLKETFDPDRVLNPGRMYAGV